MDEIQLLRDLYEPPAPAPAREVAQARARLDAVTRTRRSRRRWVLPAAGLATATAATVAVVVAMPGTSRPVPAVTPGGTTARTVLLDAALAADRQPASTGKYWHVDSQIRWFQKVKAGGYLIASTSRSEFWADRNGKATSRVRYLGARP